MSSLIAIGGVAAYLLLSANMLTWAGIPYTADGGAIFLKIHPGTYLIGLAGAVRAAMVLHARKPACTCADDTTWPWVYLAGLAVCMLHAALMTGAGNLIVLVDTFLPAGLLAVLLPGGSNQARRRLRTVLQTLILMNAVIALGEIAAQTNVIPLFLNNGELHTTAEEFRPTALYDHPLTGGSVTMMGLALLPQRGLARFLYGGVLAAGLLAFGGRIAVLSAILSVLVAYGIGAAKAIARRESSGGLQAVALLVGGVAVALVVALLFAAGLGQRLAGHLYWDASAQVRLSQWHVLGLLRPEQLLLGTRRDDLIGLIEVLRLDDGVEVIENFWLLMLISLGVSAFAVFCTAFGALLFGLWEHAPLRGRILLVAAVSTCSTSNSLGRKSCLLVLLVATLAALRAPATVPKRASHRLQRRLGRLVPG